MSMTHFSLPQLPETEQESGSTKQSNAKALTSLSILHKESFLGPVPVCPCIQRKCKFGYLVSLPKQLEKMNQKGKKKLTKGTYTNNAQVVVIVRKGEDGE